MKAMGIVAVLAVAAARAAEVDVYDNSVSSGQTVTWTTGNTYVMQEKVFVEDGAVLVIQPGVVVKALPSVGSDATALIVARGGSIQAEGTRQQPIIFTALADDLLPQGQSSFDVINATSQWGGVVILGKARNNLPGGEGRIEGIDVTDLRGAYGGTDDNDNSGVFRYVSIRFAGMEVAPDIELNGLTMGLVGAGTTIEYVEVYNNSDDGFEWFGGCVNTRYLLSMNMGDDAFDYDVGFRGRGQFWCALMGRPAPDSRLGEHDGATSPANARPFAVPVVANATYLCVNTNPRPGLITFRDNAGGKYLNSVFSDGGDFEVQDVSATDDSAERFRQGDLAMLRCLFWSSERPTSWTRWDRFNGVSTECLVSGGNAILNPGFNCTMPYGRLDNPTGALDLRPTNTAVCDSLADVAVDTSGFILPVQYKGAFCPWDTMWIRGWTAADLYGYLSANDEPAMEPLAVRSSAGARANGGLALQGVGGYVVDGNAVLVSHSPSSLIGHAELFALDGSSVARVSLRELAESGTQRIPLPRVSQGIVLCRISSGQDSRSMLLQRGTAR